MSLWKLGHILNVQQGLLVSIAGVRHAKELIITFGNIQVEEVTVECCLDASGNNGNKIIESLIVVAVDPVDDVQSTVGSQSKQVVACDGLCLSSLGDHEQLRQDRNWLKVDGEGP